MSGVGHVHSHHLLRRTARASAARWNAGARPGDPLKAKVRSLVKGPFGWKVVLERKYRSRPLD